MTITKNKFMQNSRKKAAYLTALCLALLLFLPSCGKEDSAEQESTKKEVETKPRVKPVSLLRTNTPAPAFKLVSFKGKTLSLGKYKGKVIVLNFWASWCGPCKAEAKILEETFLEYSDKGVRFIGIATSDTKENAKNFVKQFGVTYPNGLDKDLSVSKAYDVFGIPVTVIIGKEGSIVLNNIGIITKETLSKEIEKALSSNKEAPATKKDKE
ncbi:MAG: TlpA family protein disulfide reductase [Deltaproteobacteria bacterium]|nr:TlpA family protein disulfide reductase [Deltaproteobacteria bacterium]